MFESIAYRFGILFLCACFVLGDSVVALPKQKSPAGETNPATMTNPIVRNMEGWKVYVDSELVTGEFANEGQKALQMLANHMQRIEILIPAESLAKLKTIEIWIERDHPRLKGMQYHPSEDWLVVM